MQVTQDKKIPARYTSKGKHFAMIHFIPFALHGDISLQIKIKKNLALLNQLPLLCFNKQQSSSLNKNGQDTQRRCCSHPHARNSFEEEKEKS